MKKIFAFAVLAASISACNDADNNTTTVDSDTSTTTTTVTTPDTLSQTTTATYTPAEGDVSYRNGKVVVWKNNDWVVSDKDVTLDNGVVVNRKGEVRRDKDVVNLEEGEVVSRTGNFFDKAGNAIDDAWDATKRGAKKAGNAIEKGAKKVGEKTKDALDIDDKKNKKDGN